MAAAAERAGAALPDGDLADAALLCERLDGLPLSIELAGAQLRHLSLRQLIERLDARFELLTHGRHGRARRQASLLAVLEDTYASLDSTEQRLLCQLAAFPGGFDLDAVEGATYGLDIGVPARTFAGLVDCSLVVAAGRGQHRLLETVKLFAQRHWNEDEDPPARHAAWCLRHVDSYPDHAAVASTALSTWVCAHYQDLRAAEDHLLAEGDLSGVVRLIAAQSAALNLGLGGTRALGTIERVERYVACEGLSAAEEASLMLAGALAARSARRPEWIGRGARRAVELFEQAGDTTGLSAALIVDSWMTALRHTDAALALLDRSIALAEQAGAIELGLFARANRVNHLMVAVRLAEAESELERLLPLAEASPQHAPWLLIHTVGVALWILTDPPRALASAAALHAFEQQSVTSADATIVVRAAAAASSGDVELTGICLRDAVESYRLQGNDDGLPDLLLPPALLAWRLEDPRARRWLTAIRHGGRPTQNFVLTSIYRQLRHAVGLDAPIAPVDLAATFADALAWLTDAADRTGA